MFSHFSLFLSQLVKMNRGRNSLFQLVEFKIDFVLWMQNYSFRIGCWVADAEPTPTTVKVSLFSGAYIEYKGDHIGCSDSISRILFMCNNLHSRSSRQELTLLEGRNWDWHWIGGMRGQYEMCGFFLWLAWFRN